MRARYQSGRHLRRGGAALSLLPLLYTLAGCHSAFIQATVVNDTGKPIPLFEVDYPNASFGSGQFAAGQQFHYRFKVLDTGGSKLVWTDASGQEHTNTGPEMHQGQEGDLRIVMSPSGIAWQTNLHQVP